MKQCEIRWDTIAKLDEMKITCKWERQIKVNEARFNKEKENIN